MNTSTNVRLSATTLAALSYVLGWFSGLIVLLLERENRFVRFHALQSIFVFGAFNLLFLVFPLVANVLGVIPFLGGLFRLVISVVTFALVLVWVVLAVILIIAALQGEQLRIPYLGPRRGDER